MSRGKRLEIELKPRDRQQVEKLLGGGLQAVRTTLRALALRQMDQGQSTPAVGANLGLSAKAVWQIGRRYIDGGWSAHCLMHIVLARLQVWISRSSSALSPWSVRRRQRTGPLDGATVDREVIKRKLVPRVGRETIRILLESHDLKPWREKNVVRGRVG